MLDYHVDYHAIHTLTLALRTWGSWRVVHKVSSQVAEVATTTADTLPLSGHTIGATTRQPCDSLSSTFKGTSGQPGGYRGLTVEKRPCYGASGDVARRVTPVRVMMYSPLSTRVTANPLEVRYSFFPSITA